MGIGGFNPIDSQREGWGWEGLIYRQSKGGVGIKRV